MKIIRRLDFPTKNLSREYFEVTPFELLVSNLCNIRDYVYLESWKTLNGNRIRVLTENIMKPRKHHRTSLFDVAECTPFSISPTDYPDYPIRELDTGRLFNWTILMSHLGSCKIFVDSGVFDSKFPPYTPTAQELVMKMDFMGYSLSDKVRKSRNLHNFPIDKLTDFGIIRTKHKTKEDK